MFLTDTRQIKNSAMFKAPVFTTFYHEVVLKRHTPPHFTTGTSFFLRFDPYLPFFEFLCAKNALNFSKLS